MNLTAAMRKHLREYGRAVVRREACEPETDDWYTHHGAAAWHEECAEQLAEADAAVAGTDPPPSAEHEKLRGEAVWRARREADRAAKKAGKA